MSKTASFTGHRPSQLGSYNPVELKPLLWELHRVIVEHIEQKDVTTFISGMALGIDQFSSRIILKLKEKYPHIKHIAAVPCKNQFNKWPQQSKREWQDIIDKSDEVVYVSEEEYTSYCMEARNRYMVDRADYIIAVWDGNKGGTGNCVSYARKKEKPLTVINPKDFR